MFPSCLRSYQDEARGKDSGNVFFSLSTITFHFSPFSSKIQPAKNKWAALHRRENTVGSQSASVAPYGFFFFLFFFTQILESTKALVLRPLCQRECIKRQLSQAPTSEDGDECGRALTRDFSLKKKSISKKKVQ